MEKEYWLEDRKKKLKMSNDEAHELTIECIEEALLRLLDEKDFQNITITDITRLAGVSRTAFYKNFRTKEDVVEEILNKIFQELLQDITGSMADGEFDQYRMLTTMFLSLKKNKTIRLIQTGADGSIALLKYTNRMAQSHLPALNDNLYYHYYIAGAYHNVIYHWVKGGMKEAPEEMARMIIAIENADFERIM